MDPRPVGGGARAAACLADSPRATAGRPSPPGTGHAARVAVAVPILLLAAAVRLLGLGNQDLWGDEAFSVMTAIGPIRNLLGSLMTGEPHPPLYPLLLAGWLRPFGHSELVARLPSALTGILAVAVAMALARYLDPNGTPSGHLGGSMKQNPDDRSAGLVASAMAGLLVALNPFQVWYSQEARMYAQVSLFAGLATLALVRLWRGDRGATPAYALCVLGAAGSHYYGLFVPIAHGVAIVVAGRDATGLFRRWLAGSVVAAVLYLPWVVFARQIFFGYYGAAPGSVDLPSLALSSWVRVVAGWSLTWDHAVLIAAVLTLFAALGVAAPPRSPADRFLRAVLLAWILTPFVGGYLISLVRPLYAERYLVVMSLPIVLLVVRGILWGLGDALHPRPLSGRTRERGVVAPPLPAHAGAGPGVKGVPQPLAGFVVLAVAVALSLATLRNVWIGGYVKSTYNTHVKDVVALARPGDAVILDGTSQNPLYDYYGPKDRPLYGLPEKLPLDPAATAARLNQIAAENRGVWIFLYATRDYDPGYLVPSWLARHAYRGFDNWAVTGRLQYYRFVPDSALTVRPVALTFGSSLLLERYGWVDQPYRAGDTVPVDLLWKRLPTALQDAQVGLRLVDSTGFTWAQADEPLGGDFVDPSLWPAGQDTDDRHGLLIPQGTPPGEYALILSAYGAGQGTPLAISGEGAPLRPSGVEIATIRVSAPSKTLWTAGIGGFQPTDEVISDGLRLLGWAGSDEAVAGQSAYRTLFWQAAADRPSAAQVRLDLVDDRGQVAQTRDVALATPGFPTDRWRAGDVVREQYRVAVSDRLSPGRYALELTPLRPSGPPAETIPLGTIDVAGGAPVEAVPAPAHPLNVSLGGAAALTGYDLPAATVRPGSTLDLDLHWRDLAPLDSDYTVFVHLLDSGERVVAQQDQPPGGGQRPTSSWFPGDEILDRYRLALPTSLRPGRYRIEVGMYNPSDGHRLTVTRDGESAGDRVILTDVDVAAR